MTKDELTQGYETEIRYQQHMIENLGRWFSLFFLIASIGVVVLYFFHRGHLALFILGLVLTVLGILAMLIVGYGIYKGRLNIEKVMADFDAKLKAVQS